MGIQKSGTKSVSKSLLSVEEASELLGTDRATCYRAIRNGTFPLPVVRLGGRIRIPLKAIERLVDGASFAIEASPIQLASMATCCPACGAPPSAVALPSRRRPTCLAARRSSSAITSV